MSWPTLPSRAAYLTINNAKRRNALSLSVLRDLKSQIVKHNTSSSGTLRILPPFTPSILTDLEAISQGTATPSQISSHAWLLDAPTWQAERSHLPNILVLRSQGPIFSSGHDLREISKLSHDEVKETFALCAEVMTLLRRSPSIVVGVIQGLATAAGAQLALTTDIPVALASTLFRLPGQSIGLPCTSPSTAASRTLGDSFTFRMLALAEGVRADHLPNSAVDIVPHDESEPNETRQTKLESRVNEIVTTLSRTAGQPQALGKWAFWTQAGIRGREAEAGLHGSGGERNGGNGYEEAVSWAGRMMALHARCEDAREGMSSFLEKRDTLWKT